MEIRRFGIGHRRPDGPPGTQGVEAASIHGDGRGVVAEVALRRNAAIAPHSNPNLTYFVVIEGGGFVQVGDERARVAAGEAVVWPPNVIHAAWTELTPMRAIVVEFAPVEGDEPLLLSGGELEAAAVATPVAPPLAEDSIRGQGALAPKPTVRPVDRKSPDEEPW